VFAVRGTRAATVLDELLTDAFTGVVVCDRAKMYWGLGRLQWCWAHLAPDFQALADSEDGVVKRLGHGLPRPNAIHRTDIFTPQRPVFPIFLP
jgi:hypothetical protein